MGLRQMLQDRELLKLAEEGRRLGFLEDALAITPPQVRRRLEEAEARAAKRKERRK